MFLLNTCGYMRFYEENSSCLPVAQAGHMEADPTTHIDAPHPLQEGEGLTGVLSAAANTVPAAPAPYVPAATGGVPSIPNLPLNFPCTTTLFLHSCSVPVPNHSDSVHAWLLSCHHCPHPECQPLLCKGKTLSPSGPFTGLFAGCTDPFNLFFLIHNGPIPRALGARRASDPPGLAVALTESVCLVQCQYRHRR